ncbi:glycosyltransferase family 2 protein [Leucobacter denitrificans]|uniref:Glycosyltransferase family 2 protein n=1 Tax=Leucobacter denitrificans TaxID=683042 RepID=A0A7G9S3J9_9MICO|nr:glycosyltransferase family 2 protein [Leucobacter denitrificans]QNN62424.1 glycosyltransferase family 2 protein [Leucobacter denitrificans]
MAESFDENRPNTRPVPIVDHPAHTNLSGRVAAIIVTFNRLGKLPKTIETVLAQSYGCDWVVIVNNNSTDGTRGYLDDLNDPRLRVLHLDENLGGAGGFEHGMAYGYNLGADYVWVMDDDCYPESSALEILLDQRDRASQALGYDVPFACSLVKFIDGSLCEMNNPITTWDWPRAYLDGLNSFKVAECTFVSVLIPRWAIEEVGLPLGEYFIWFDDKEFTKRLEGHFGAGIIALESQVVHDMGVNAGVNYRQVDESNIWKFEKGARNQGSFLIHYRGRIPYALYCLRIFREMREGKVARPVRRRMYKALKESWKFNPKPRFAQDPRYALGQ